MSKAYTEDIFFLYSINGYHFIKPKSTEDEETDLALQKIIKNRLLTLLNDLFSQIY